MASRVAALVTYIKTLTLSPVLGGISPNPMPPTASFPYVTVTEIRAVGLEGLDGPQDLMKTIMQVNVWDKSYEVADSIRQQLSNAIIWKSGSVGGGIVNGPINHNMNAELYDAPRQIHQLISRFNIAWESGLYILEDFTQYPTLYPTMLDISQLTQWSTQQKPVVNVPAYDNTFFITYTGALRMGANWPFDSPVGSSPSDYAAVGFLEHLSSDVWPNNNAGRLRIKASAVFSFIAADALDGRVLGGPALQMSGSVSPSFQTDDCIAAIYEYSPNAPVPVAKRVAIAHIHGYTITILASLNLVLTSGQKLSIERDRVDNVYNLYVNDILKLRVSDTVSLVQSGRAGMLGYTDGSDPANYGSGYTSWTSFTVEG